MELEKELEKQRKKVDTTPSEAAIKAENYSMGHIKINGFQISIENPKGSYRRGKDRNGKEWKTYMHNDYGYFTKTVGKDGDAIDVFIGPNLKSTKIFAIDQKIGGKFDETKVMFCFSNPEQAKKAYLSNYEKDWKGFWKITETDIDTFRKWLYDGHRQYKPFFEYKEFRNKLNEDTMKKNTLKLNEKTIREMVKKALKENADAWTPESTPEDKKWQEDTMYANYGNKSQYAMDSPYYPQPYGDGELSMDAQLGKYDPDYVDEFDPEMTPHRGDDPEYWKSSKGDMCNESKVDRIIKEAIQNELGNPVDIMDAIIMIKNAYVDIQDTAKGNNTLLYDLATAMGNLRGAIKILQEIDKNSYRH